MKNTFDFVMDDLIEKYSIEDLEETFTKLNIKNIYVFREISKKEDLEKDFILPKSKILKLKKAYLLKEPSLAHFYKKKELFLVISQSLKNNTVISTSKNIPFLYNPLSDKLIFDEQNARSCFQHKVKVIFNYNLLRDKPLQNKYLKQNLFIVNLLKIHLVDFIFASFAKTKEDLVSRDVLFSLLKNFDLEESFILKILSKGMVDNKW
ncbi:MAG: hypothetical protein PHX47_02780 [Candidatus ainarchaeum sp.]|nr:hypothetical protein [Candidatus ainarchaeum sp.]